MKKETDNQTEAKNYIKLKCPRDRSRAIPDRSNTLPKCKKLLFHPKGEIYEN